jgi:hypothetical protein
LVCAFAWSLTPPLPLAGTPTAARGKLWNTTGVAGCLTSNKSESAGASVSCRALSATFNLLGKVQWGTRKTRLSELMKATSASYNFKYTVKRGGQTIEIPFGSGDAAHHIIPNEITFSENIPEILNKAAQAKWHCQCPLDNGFPVPAALHTGATSSTYKNHNVYSRYVSKILKNLDGFARNGENTAESCAAKLMEVIEGLKTQIDDAVLQNKKLDDYFADLL